MEPEPQERHFNIQIEPQALAGCTRTSPTSATPTTSSRSRSRGSITTSKEPEVPGIAVVRVNLAPLFMRQLIDALQDDY